MATNFLEDENDFRSVVHLDQPVGGNGSVHLTSDLNNHSPKNDGTESSLLHAVENSLIQTLSPINRLAKGEFLLRRLKSVLSRRKRKVDLQKEEMSENALNLLADLALSVSNGQVPPQPNQALEIIPKESMKCELTKALSSADHESVLHALLKNTAANAIQPLQCPSPSPHVGNSELIGFISKEHNYSLPPSSSLLLDLPGATFQVQPLSGSTGLLNHHQSMHSNEVRTPQPSFIQEDLWENNMTPDYFHRHRQKFRHSRTFDFKDGSIQVTRKWQENYDFNLDSRFTSHPKDQVIIRALHGPCDFSSQDTSEEVRLIFHLWIGLFYSRSTSRFFQIDPSVTQHCFEEIKSLKKSSELVSDWTEHSTNPSDAFSSVTSTPDPLASEALDLRKKEDTLLEPDSEILDLSLRSSSEESVSSGLQINREVSSAQSKDFEALTNLKSTEESKEEETPKLCKTMNTESVNEVNDDGNIESDKTETCQKDLWLNHEEAPPSKVDGAYFSQPEDISVNLELETASTVLGSDLVLHECNKATTFLKDSIENPQATKGLEQKCKTALPSRPKSVTDKILNSNSEESDLVHSNNVEGFKMKNDSCIEVNIDFLPDVIDTDGVSADQRLDIICKGDLVNEKHLSSQETKADSPDYSEYLNGDVDCCERLEEFQNDCLREEKLDMKKTGYSTKVDIALICKHVPKTSDSPVKGDCTSENIDQAQMHDQLLPDNSNHGVNHLCANPVPLKDEISVLNFNAQVEITNISKDAAAEDNFKTIENSDQKPAFSDESACTQDESPTVPCIPNQNDDIETENKTNASNLDFNLCCNDQKQETSPTEREEKTGEIIPEHSPSFDSEVVKMCVPDKFSEKTYSKAIGTNGGGEKNWDGVVIPSLREDAADDHVLQLDEVEKAVKDQETIPFIKEATRPFDELPSAESSTLKSCDVKKKSPCSTTPQDNTETQKLEACESMSDSRSATPTIDEKPFEYMSSSSPTSCTFTNGDHETCQDVTLKCPSRNSTLVMKELSFEKILQPSTANNDSPIASSICGPHSDVKQRTLRLLESINDYISTGCDIPHQIKAADIKSPDPLNISVKKCPPTCLELSSITVDVTNQRAGNEPHPDMSSFSSQDLYPKPTDGISLPIKTISEEVPNVKLQMNEKSSTSKHYLKRSYRHQTSVESEHQSYGYLTSVEGFQDGNKTTLHYKSRSHTHHAVMAVGLNKSVESPTQQLSKDNHVETTSRNKKPRIHITEKSSATSTLLKKTKKHILKNQGRLRYRTGHPTGQNRRNDFSDKPFTYEDNVPRGQDSIVCTIFNTSLKKSYCVLDQLSQRSLPDDPTQASIDQERLIFSEQMKNLLRKSKSGPVCQQNVFDSLKQSCNNPIIVNFSNLEEQEDSLEFWDTQYVRQKIMVDMTDRKCLTESTKGKKMLQDFSQETSIPGETAKISEMIAEGARIYETKMFDVCSVKKTSSRSKKVYCGYSRTKPRNHFDFCDQMKKELDKTFLSNLNAVVKKSCKTKYRFYLVVTSDDVFFKETKAASFPSEMRPITVVSSANDWVAVMGQTAVMGVETAYLDAESHTAVQPCEFFSDEDNPACLLIILRNEDIAEHICKIPHLLRLKMTPGVQFAGIDEPDDIVNLTYQELFTRGGFIMLDRAVLESLSLCNMKIISDILQELSRIEKWKWMMHYRDSRRLKENARLSGEANEKKHFLNWGQDAGILEVLPYHECDSLSRDQPDYVACLHRLQIQHISSRYPVFVTDDTSHSAFEENGIFTMTLNTFLKKSATEIFPI
uniref:Family with sequence similarity 208, member B n=1 Tax=Nothobranchius kuhntae TaxID=321403 RepID=A0A1A8JC77_NOTKU